MLQHHIKLGYISDMTSLVKKKYSPAGSGAPLNAYAAKHVTKPAYNGKQKQITEVNSLLRSEIAHLWPTITSIAALQQECVATLPQVFLYCQVLHLEAEQLVLAAPNSAFASKLKQQLPKLQSALQKAGWQINAIRIKVQANQTLPAEPAKKQCHFSPIALESFVTLEKNLAQSNHNDALLDALRTLLERHR